MQLATVVGQATSTIKHPSLHGWRLLIAQLLTADGKPDGEPILAIDSLGSSVGSQVIVSNEGGGARELVKDRTSPVRWMVLGICDR